MDDLPRRIDRAKELLRTIKHATMATVNEDGSPHNTPFVFLHDATLSQIFWGSHPESQHSRNVLRTGQLFVVMYDALERGGLYIQAEGGCMLDGTDLDAALAVHNTFRKRFGKPPISRDYYTSNGSQRMWSARAVHFWVNGEERDRNGLMIKDYRQEVTAQDLLILKPNGPAGLLGNQLA